MFKALIIDDEIDCRESLLKYLNQYCININVVAQSNCVSDGLQKIKEHSPDVIFLDVQMPDGSGFDLLSQLPSVDFNVIFVTAYDHFAIQAIKFSALDYLLKPVDPLLLIEAVNKIKNNEAKHVKQKYQTLINNSKRFEKIALPTMDGIVFINIKNIVRCQADRNYTKFYIDSGESFLVAKTLKEYDEMLCNLNFFRVHQSHLINLSFVKKYLKGEGGFIIMEDGSEITVARRRKEELLSILTNLR